MSSRFATLCFDVNDLPGMITPAPAYVPPTPAPAASAPPQAPPAVATPSAEIQTLAAAVKAAEDKVAKVMDARRADSVLPILADPEYLHLPAIQAVLNGPGMHDEFGGLTDAAKAKLAEVKAAKPHLFKQEQAAAPAPTAQAPKQTIPDLPAPDPAMGGRPMTVEAWRELAKKDRAAAHQPALLRAMGFLK